MLEALLAHEKERAAELWMFEELRWALLMGPVAEPPERPELPRVFQ